MYKNFLVFFNKQKFNDMNIYIVMCLTYIEFLKRKKLNINKLMKKFQILMINLSLNILLNFIKIAFINFQMQYIKNINVYIIDILNKINFIKILRLL